MFKSTMRSSIDLKYIQTLPVILGWISLFSFAVIFSLMGYTGSYVTDIAYISGSEVWIFFGILYV